MTAERVKPPGIGQEAAGPHIADQQDAPWRARGQPDAALPRVKATVAIFAEIGEPAGPPGQPEIWKLVEQWAIAPIP